MSRFGKFLLLIAALILGHQVVMEPIVGLPDNGDFVRLTSVFRLTPINHPDDPDRFFRYVVKRYRYDAGQPIVFHQITSEHLTMATAVGLNLAHNKDGYFDIRMMGIVHAALMLLALYLALPLFESRHLWRNAATGALILLVFADVGYVQYCNSLYIDTGSVLFLLLAMIAGLRLVTGHGSGDWNFRAFCLFVVLFALSKSEHSVLAFILLAGLPLLPGVTRKQKLILGGVTAAAVALVMLTAGTDLRRIASYNMLFTGILPNSPSPQDALAEFGLEPGLATYSGSSTYSENSGLKSPLVREQLEQRLSQFRLALYFLRHPDLAAKLMGRGLGEAATMRLAGFGNFAKDAGRPARDQSRAYSLWSIAKRRLFDRQPYRLLGYFLVSLAALTLGLWRQGGRQLAWTALLLGIMAGAAWAIACLSDVLDMHRHLYLCTFLFDFIFVSACGVWLTQDAPRSAP